MDLAKIKNSNIYFLGWRETDISIDIDGNIPDPTFKGSFTCYGSGKNGNRAYNIESGKQLSDNIKEYGERNDRWYRAWFGKKCEEVAKDPNTLFLPYNIYFSTLIPSKLQNRIICQNNPDIVQTLNSKIIFKEMIDGTIPQAPFLVRSGAEILRDFENYQKEVVVQTEFGSNGDGTFLLTKKNLRDQEFVKNFLDHIEIDENYIISDFIKNRCSASFQIQVTNTETLMYSPGVQKMDGAKFIGSDPFEFDSFEPEIKKDVSEMAEQIGNILRIAGYRGYAGIDILVAEKGANPSVYAVEINPRFTGTTGLKNKEAHNAGVGTVYWHSILAHYADETNLRTDFEKIKPIAIKTYAKIGENDDTGRNTEGYHLTTPLDEDHYTFAKYQKIEK